jgi:signal transduction histidine kinase/CheY-like chemotaxis protein
MKGRPSSIPTLERAGKPWPAAQLVIIEGRGVGRRFKILDSATLGRSPEATIMLDDLEVSRLHGRLSRTESGAFGIQDLSRNGTYVNGVRIERCQLSPGDRVRFGPNVTMEFGFLDPAEDQALERQRFEAIGRLGVGIAHDLKNLLAALDAGVAFLEELPLSRSLGDAEVRACLADLELAVGRAGELTRSILSFARGRGTDRACVDLATLIGEVVKMLRHVLERNIRIELTVRPNIFVYGSRSELHQVLLNLCLNARDAMPNGGVLRIAAAPREISTGEPAQNPHQETALLTVTDTGTGMDQETQRRVFEPFFTTKGEGAGYGLGLATVREIVEAHGGTIAVSSAPGEGSAFAVHLPILDSVATSLSNTQQRAPVSPRRNMAQTIGVLLVDDEQIVRRSVARRLRHAGFRVTEADGGTEAVALYDRAEHDLVLLDLDMPGLDGEQTQEKLAEIDPDVRIVFATGYVDAERSVAAQDRGALALLEKPYDLDKLVSLATQVAQGGGFGDSEPPTQSA